MDPTLVGIMLIAIALTLLALGMPVAFTFAVVGALGLGIFRDWAVVLDFLGRQSYSIAASWVYVVLPLFVLTGSLAASSGITANAFSLANKWIGHFRGGLAIAAILASAGFGAACGSSVAASVAMTKVALPEMRARGYDPRMALGTVCAGGLLAIMIPPSGVFVLYGIITGESIGKLLIAGILPGILTTVVFSIGILILVRRMPHLAPPAGVAAPWRERLVSLKDSVGALTIFLVVMGGIWTGVFTPTEAAAFGAITALVFVFLKARNPLAAVRLGLSDAASTTAMVFLIIVGALLFSSALTMAGIPQKLTAFIVGLQVPTIVIVIAILALYIPLGMFLDPASMQFLTVPFLYPALIKLGVSPIWFGVLLCHMIEMSLLTPPVGLNVYAVAGAARDVKLEDVFRAVTPFLMMEVVVLALLVAFPEISLFLPRLMTGR